MIPPNAPGCFASALAFKKDNPICQRCPFGVDCEPQHIANLAELRSKLGIKLKPQPTPAKRPERGIDGLPKKTQELVTRLEAMNLNIVSSLKSGANPFPSSISFMRIAAHILIKLGFVEPKMLTMSFATKLNWSPETAAAHARMAIQALVHIGAVDLSDGRAELRR